MQKSFWWLQYSDRYIISLSPTSIPLPPFSPSRISLIVSQCTLSMYVKLLYQIVSWGRQFVNVFSSVWMTLLVMFKVTCICMRVSASHSVIVRVRVCVCVCVCVYFHLSKIVQEALAEVNYYKAGYIQRDTSHTQITHKDIQQDTLP